jgi:hypothetical protein
MCRSSAAASSILGLGLDDDQWFGRLRDFEGDRPQRRIGPYELLGELGRGGQGIVYRARQPRTGRQIALKRIGAGAFATPEMRLS